LPKCGSPYPSKLEKLRRPTSGGYAKVHGGVATVAVVERRSSTGGLANTEERYQWPREHGGATWAWGAAQESGTGGLKAADERRPPPKMEAIFGGDLLRDLSQ
jgi:hypothetical protein